MNRLFILTPILFFMCSTAPDTIQAATYIALDFEKEETGLNPVSKTGYPLWSLQPSFDRVFGEGNHFEISDQAHTGKHSLKFTYEARNSFCNTCGKKTLTHKSGLDSAGYFVAKTAEDLTQEFYPKRYKNPKNPKKGTYTPPGPHLSPGKIIYNKSRGYSKWQVTSISNGNAKNDKANLKLLEPGIGEFSNQKSVINDGDKVVITRQCDVDGIIGRKGGKFDVSRRSDCDGVITWFSHIEPMLQPSGGSIFRRVYLKASITSPPSGQKLNYARFMRGAGKKYAREIYAIASSKSDKLELHLTGLGKMGGANRYKPGTHKKGNLPDELYFEPGVWYYIEQEYKAETYRMTTHIDDKGTVIVDSYKGNGDGEYRLWFAKSGEESSTPLLDVRNLKLPPILGGTGTHMSLWGNVGHHSDTYGSWYMDDIKVSSEQIGPAR